MSSILKALKKLEDEKTSRFPDSLNLGSDILKGEIHQRRRSPFALAVTLLAVFGGGVGAAYFIMKDTRTPVTPVLVQQQPTATMKPLPAPAAALPVSGKPAPSQTKPVASPAQKKPAVAVTRAPVQKKNSVRTTTPHSVPPAATKSVRHTPDKPVSTDPVPVKTAAPVTPVPLLRVNGIAFQNSTADSMAIINGNPVASGSTVEGVTVEEIKRDRVLFQRNGERFEVRLGQANR